MINEYNNLKKYFCYSLCADEVFLQTILINSPRLDTVKDENLRYIDWERGNPYVFRTEDYDSLFQSKKLFARKFDITVDETIVNMIHDKLLATECKDREIT